MSRLGSRLNTPRFYITTVFVLIGLAGWLKAPWTNDNRESGSGSAQLRRCVRVCVCVCENGGGFSAGISDVLVGEAKVRETGPQRWAPAPATWAEMQHRHCVRCTSFSLLCSVILDCCGAVLLCVVLVTWHNFKFVFKLLGYFPNILCIV